MAIEIKLPDLGDGVESGDVLEVFVSEGDQVEEGQDLICLLYTSPSPRDS